MSITKGALFSLSASKTLGKAVTFIKGRRFKAVRSHFIPHQPNSPGQLYVREWFASVNMAWSLGYVQPLNKRAFSYQAKILNPQSSGCNMLMKLVFEAIALGDVSIPLLIPPALTPPNIRIRCVAQNLIPVELHIVRGLNAGYRDEKIGQSPMLTTFDPLPYTPDSICEIKYLGGVLFGSSGYFTLDPLWWV